MSAAGDRSVLSAIHNQCMSTLECSHSSWDGIISVKASFGLGLFGLEYRITFTLLVIDMSNGNF